MASNSATTKAPENCDIVLGRLLEQRERHTVIEEALEQSEKAINARVNELKEACAREPLESGALWGHKPHNEPQEHRFRQQYATCDTLCTVRVLTAVDGVVTFVVSKHLYVLMEVNFREKFPFLIARPETEETADAE